MDPTEAEAKLCTICSAASSQACGNCKKVNYCCREHQKSDWKNHKAYCFPAAIATRKTEFNEDEFEYEEKIERVLVATRLIHAGEIIFREKPLCSGPRVHDSYLTGFDTTKFPVCLGCYRIVRGDYRCSCCAWPVCNEACEKAKQHSEFECKVFSRLSIEPFGPDQVEDYVSICIIRCLLLKELDPKKWEELMELDPHDVDLEFSFLQVTRHHAVFINDVCQLKCDLKTISLVSTILRRERRVPEDNDDLEGARMGSYVYYLGCRLTHSCVPNSMWFIRTTSEFMVRASTDIKPGEVISAASVELGDGTLRRRTNLLYSKIYCTCERCKDPTELNTFMSAVRCQVCRDGWLLSIDPMTLTSDWRCNNNDCAKIEEPRKICEIVEGMETQLKVALTSGTRDLRHIRAMESAIKKWEGTRVHTNHYILTRFKMRIIGMIIAISIDLKEVDRDEMESKLVVWTRECLNLADVYWPGYTRYRGQLIYFLQRGLFCLIFTEMERLAKSRRPTNYTQGRLKALRIAFLEVLKLRKEGINILDIEVQGGTENTFAQEMKHEGYDFETVRRVLSVPVDQLEAQPNP